MRVVVQDPYFVDVWRGVFLVGQLSLVLMSPPDQLDKYDPVGQTR
jgi:hypothetical protein